MSVFLIYQKHQYFDIYEDLMVALSKEAALRKILTEYSHVFDYSPPFHIREIDPETNEAVSSEFYVSADEVRADLERSIPLVKPARARVYPRAAPIEHIILSPPVAAAAAAPFSPQVMTPPLSPVRSPTLQMGAPPVGYISPGPISPPVSFAAAAAVANPSTVTNPKTGRSIAVGKATYNALIKEGYVLFNGTMVKRQ